mgnify:CR=1|jgi:hypothetical protein
MTFIERLVKLAEDLEKEGFVEESDELTNAIENDMAQVSEPILIDKDDSDMHTMIEPQQPQVQPSPMQMPEKEIAPEPQSNTEQLEEELTEGILALLAKNNDFILGENGEIGNSDEEFVDALMNLAS